MTARTFDRVDRMRRGLDDLADSIEQATPDSELPDALRESAAILRDALVREGSAASTARERGRAVRFQSDEP